MSLTPEQWRELALDYAKALRLVKKHAGEIQRIGKIKASEADHIVKCWNSACYDEDMKRIQEEE